MARPSKKYLHSLYEFVMGKGEIRIGGTSREFPVDVMGPPCQRHCAGDKAPGLSAAIYTCLAQQGAMNWNLQWIPIALCPVGTMHSSSSVCLAVLDSLKFS